MGATSMINLMIIGLTDSQWGNIICCPINFAYCHPCDYTTETDGNLKVHTQEMHAPVVKTCNRCDYTAETDKNLIDHTQKEHSSSTKTCNQCDYTTKKDGNLKVHIQRMHAPVEVEPQQENAEQRNISEYRCNFCEFVSSSIDSIWNHKLDKQTGQSFNFNNLDKDDRKDFLFHMLADQNNDLLEEVWV